MHADDEDELDALSRAIANCSGALSSGCRVSSQRIGSVCVRVREGSLADGVGVRVWGVALSLSAELAAHPALLAGAEVLEIGSGCGLTGIAAALLGAARVTMTDSEPAVLDNLARCVRMNAGAAGGGGGGGGGGGDGSGGGSGGGSGSGDGDGSDGDADAANNSAEAGGAGRGGGPWAAANMRVATLDWREALAAEGSSADGGAACSAAGRDDGGAAGPGASDGPPAVRGGVTFDLIIGTDVVYESPHDVLVPAVLRRHLRPGGAALLCCAVRQTALFTSLAAACAARGLRYRAVTMPPPPGSAGIVGQPEDYEGGFLLMAIDRADAPCARWHRSDFAAPL